MAIIGTVNTIIITVIMAGSIATAVAVAVRVTAIRGGGHSSERSTQFIKCRGGAVALVQVRVESKR
jgi:hypothetical protein